MKFFAILDVKANYFQTPFADKTTVDAIRGFTSVVNKKGTIYNDFPDDFAICELGEFDVNTGKIAPHQNPINISTGRPLLKADAPTGAPMPMSNAPRAV